MSFLPGAPKSLGFQPKPVVPPNALLLNGVPLLLNGQYLLLGN